MAATMTKTPFRVSRSATKPMRRMLMSRSSLEKPRPFDRFSRTTSPSSTSTFLPRERSSRSSSSEMVDLPAPERPVSQMVAARVIATPISSFGFLAVPRLAVAATGKGHVALAANRVDHRPLGRARLDQGARRHRLSGEGLERRVVERVDVALEILGRLLAGHVETEHRLQEVGQ